MPSGERVARHAHSWMGMPIREWALFVVGLEHIYAHGHFGRVFSLWQDNQDITCTQSVSLLPLAHMETFHLTSFPLHLELETIGFYPDQAEEYIAKNLRNLLKADAIHSFLKHRLLLQGLVRIPIQLDALLLYLGRKPQSRL